MQHLIRKRADDKDFMEIRVAVVGNVDAGKSTLLGTGSCLYFLYQLGCPKNFATGNNKIVSQPSVGTGHEKTLHF